MRASLDGALSSALSRSSHRQPSVFFSSLAITRLGRRLFPLIFFSTVRSTLFESFLFRPAPAASSSEPESLYLDIQRVTNRRSNPVLRQISAIVRPSLCKKTTAPRSSTGLRDMRFFRKNRKKPVRTKTPNLEYVVCCAVNIFVVCKELSRAKEVP